MKTTRAPPLRVNIGSETMVKSGKQNQYIFSNFALTTYDSNEIYYVAKK